MFWQSLHLPTQVNSLAGGQSFKSVCRNVRYTRSVLVALYLYLSILREVTLFIAAINNRDFLQAYYSLSPKEYTAPVCSLLLHVWRDTILRANSKCKVQREHL